MANLLGIVQTSSSVLLRLGTYLFLRIIPGPPLYIVIPAIFGVYLLSFLVERLFGSSIPVNIKVDGEETTEARQDGTQKKLEGTDGVQITAKSTPPPVTINTILFDLPTPVLWAKALGLLINLACFAMAADFLARPLFETHDDLVFTRVGAVYHDAAKIVVRYPLPSDGLRIVWKQMDGTGTLAHSDSDGSGWIDGPALDLKVENDWVGVTTLDSLWASTRYQYRLATLNSTLLPYPAKPITFRTFPDPRLPGTHFKFVASSCVLPNFPYSPWAPSTRIEGFRLLRQQLDSKLETSSQVGTSIPTPGATADGALTVLPEELQLTSDPHESNVSTISLIPEAPLTDATSSTGNSTALVEETSSPLTPLGLRLASPFVPTEFMILMGDFIYADVPYFVGDSKEEYNRLYRRNYASEDFRQIYEQLPILNIYDDHEIKNDFEGRSNESTYLFPNASSAFAIYQGEANYHTYTDVNGRPANYFDFKYGDVAFFVLDTRRYRSVTGSSVTEDQPPTIIGEKQMSDFHQWAARVNSTAAFKFVISSVPVSALWGGLNGQVDTWVGAVKERRTFLDLLEYIPNVIIISGDRHEFAAVEYITGTKEFSISPFSQFYVPYLKTFYLKNGQTREIQQMVKEEVNGTLVQNDTMGRISEEKILTYLPHGNHKWGTFEVDTTNASTPTVTFQLSINGARAWTHTIVGKPVKHTGGTALGAQIAQISGSIRGVLGKLGKIFG